MSINGMRSIKMSKNIFIIILSLATIFLTTVSAQTYYADVTIGVDELGFVTIDGLTNYPDFLENTTENYTIKNQSYWFLNITKVENFTNFVYTLTLPEGSSINYIKSTGSIRIEEDQGRLVVRGFGENEPLSIQVQYQIEKSLQNASIKLDPILILLIGIIIFLVVLLLIIFVRERTKIVEIKKDSSDFRGLNHRQKQIIKLLMDSKEPLTQTDIQKSLDIPKAAVSRNIRTLEHKNLIEKEQVGMSNLIRLKKS